VFQGLLFDDDNEARAQELARRTVLEKAHVEAEARKAAWDAGQPFPDDAAKWAAAHRDLIAAKCREAYSQNSEWHLHSTARNRAEKLGCKIGRRAPILNIYRRARADKVIPCYWCMCLTKPGERQVDHIQPLSKGGEHSAGNLCISCIDCNLSKGDGVPEEFRERMAGNRSTNRLILTEYYTKRTVDDA
jgi:5-methylcytosine-specific restriction endonuclease McrA